MRSFEVYDIKADTPEALQLVQSLLALGRDTGETAILLAAAADNTDRR
ncbi:hypothetical protein O7626_29735 [Micromonospora sp. WMMD1102]|nr:hypothetical protein [Micromonospora sp. WMMD1102]MDG4790053.1 hypothetical protein [Micromonospora sp. WMMD1102]